jgi:hypothetical protein
MADSTDINIIQSDFQKHVKNMYGTHATEYTSSDLNFLNQVMRLYGNTMSAKGINLIDPIYANMFYYNKMQNRALVDFPRVNRTYVFITRPELNFSYENIASVPFFKWIYSKPIGKMCMSALTDPYYFINAPGAFNSLSTLNNAEIKDIVTQYLQIIKTANNTINNAAGVKFDDASSVTNFTSTTTDTEQAEEDALNSIDLDSISDDNAVENLISSSNYSTIRKGYEKFNTDYESVTAKLAKNLTAATAVTSESGKGILTLHQAKNILRANHSSVYYKFNYTSPFIPILQNTCTNLTGAKDFNLESFSYDSDEFGSNIQVPTGMDEVWGSGTLSTTHEDIEYGPVSLIYMLWILYIHYVSRGYITTTREHILERILDYTCSIYVFVIGGNGRSIERFGKFTGCYPTSFPLSQQLEHNSQIDKEMLRKIQINWGYNRYEPMNPEIFTDFNFVSETEWLFRLKNWDAQYNRASHLAKDQFLSFYFGEKTSPFERSLLHAGGRNSAIWDIVQTSDRGMSGNVPRALINGTSVDGSTSGISYSDLLNNYWGGYPYINKGSEFLWVKPVWSSEETSFDRSTAGGNKEAKYSTST